MPKVCLFALNCDFNWLPLVLWKINNPVGEREGYFHVDSFWFVELHKRGMGCTML